MGHIGLPVQIVLKLYEPFFIHHVLKKDKDNLLKGIIEKYMSTDELDTNIIKNFINKVNEIPKDIDSVTINILKETIQEIVKDKVVAYKRDPVENRESWISSYIRVDGVGFSAKLNSFDLCKNGGDYDGDTISIFALLTDEAQEQAKQSMNVLHSKSAWESSLRYNDSAFSLTQDAATAIYSATIH
jgi:DNA-directed RNA polymerase beta' subunit